MLPSSTFLTTTKTITVLLVVVGGILQSMLLRLYGPRLPPLRRYSHAAARLAQMAIHSHRSAEPACSLLDLPKTNHFTTHLPPDPAFPTPADSHRAPREKLGPRTVKGALYTYVRPERQKEPELLAVSPRALHDLGLRPGEEQTDLFRDVVAGNALLGWDEEKGEGLYPWAQCYGGGSFGGSGWKHRVLMRQDGNCMADSNLPVLADAGRGSADARSMISAVIVARGPVSLVTGSVFHDTSCDRSPLFAANAVR